MAARLAASSMLLVPGWLLYETLTAYGCSRFCTLACHGVVRTADCMANTRCSLQILTELFVWLSLCSVGCVWWVAPFDAWTVASSLKQGTFWSCVIATMLDPKLLKALSNITWMFLHSHCVQVMTLFFWHILYCAVDGNANGAIWCVCLWGLSYSFTCCR